MSTPDPRLLLDALGELESLRDPGKATAAGLRHFRRLVVRGDAELQPIEQTRLDRTPIPVQLRDVGWGGLGFICQEKLEVGSVWRVCFLSHGFAIGQQAAMIRHCRAVRDGVYLAGARFCIESGLLHLLGVDPNEATAPEQLHDATTHGFSFLPPAEVA